MSAYITALHPGVVLGYPNEDEKWPLDPEKAFITNFCTGILIIELVDIDWKGLTTMKNKNSLKIPRLRFGKLLIKRFLRLRRVTRPVSLCLMSRPDGLGVEYRNHWFNAKVCRVVVNCNHGLMAP